MSTYKGATPPNTKINPKIVDFFEAFYATSDSPTEQSHLDYANSLTKDATLIMGIKEAQGYDAILAFRKGLWTGPVKTRKHTLNKIFPFGEDASEVMVYGSVDYVLTNGKSLTVNWAGRAEMVDQGGELKMKFYQVYLDSAAVVNALKD
jgi:hypothetical protein